MIIPVCAAAVLAFLAATDPHAVRVRDLGIRRVNSNSLQIWALAAMFALQSGEGTGRVWVLPGLVCWAFVCAAVIASWSAPAEVWKLAGELIPSEVRSRVLSLSQPADVTFGVLRKTPSWWCPRSVEVLFPSAFLDGLSAEELACVAARQLYFRQRGNVATALLLAGVFGAYWSLSLLVLAVAGAVMIVRQVRRADLEADRWAAQKIGDPEAYIRTLEKVDRLLREAGVKSYRGVPWCRLASLEQRRARLESRR